MSCGRSLRCCRTRLCSAGPTAGWTRSSPSDVDEHPRLLRPVLVSRARELALTRPAGLDAELRDYRFGELVLPLRTRADRPRTLRRRRGSASSVSSGLHAARRTLHKKRAQTPLRPAPKFQDASTPDPYCMFPLACSPWLRVAIAPDGSVTAVRCGVDPAQATALGRPRGRRSSDRSSAGVFRSLRHGMSGRGRGVRPPRSRWRA